MDSSKRDPFLYLTNRYSNSECSETLTQDSSVMNSRGKPTVNTAEVKSHRSVNPPQQRANFEKASAKKTRPQSDFSKAFSYMEIIRSKSGAESNSSFYSHELNSKRVNPRHNYSVADFNKFKNKLLKNHSRNYYIYDSVNLNNEFLKSHAESMIENYKPIINQIQPPSQSNHSTQSTPSENLTRSRPEKHISQIKSIYETIQRANNAKIFSLETRRSNYLNNIKNSESILSSSLMVQKIK